MRGNGNSGRRIEGRDWLSAATQPFFAAQQRKYFLLPRNLRVVISYSYRQLRRFREELVINRYALVAAASLAAIASASPASAKMMACDGASMSKTYTMVSMMPDSPNKMMMNREIGMANMEMSKGNMRGACMRMMKVQRMSSMQPMQGQMMGPMQMGPMPMAPMQPAPMQQRSSRM
jgi:hypothetical protein